MPRSESAINLVHQIRMLNVDIDQMQPGTSRSNKRSRCYLYKNDLKYSDKCMICNKIICKNHMHYFTCCNSYKMNEQ